MNLAVFVKHVPDAAEADLRIADGGRAVRTEDLPFQMNEWDRFALEEAARLKEAAGGTLTAYLIGPEAHEDSLRRCLAVGADRAVRIWDEGFTEMGPAAVVEALAKAAEAEGYDLLLFGAQAADDGYAAVGPGVAARLGLPWAALVCRLELGEGRIVCDRELEAGWLERVELRLPAVVTIQTGINEPRYVSILGIRKARSKPLEVKAPADLGLDPAALERAGRLLTVEALEPPPPGREAEILEGSPAEVARRAVEILREKGGVL
ncbi:electron transfer flavoprotein subunit beta/FixA family protein [Deferrisoma sp.]